MYRKNMLLLLLVSVVAVIFQTACGSKSTSVRIAVPVPLTGEMGSEGQGMLRGIQLAIEQANAAHRFPYTLEVVPFDDRSDPKEAVNVANLIISDPRIVAVIGHYNSGCAIPAAKVYARAPVPFITPAATNPEVTRQQLRPDWSGPRMVFRVDPTDDVQGSFAANYAYHQLGLRRISILQDKTPYGQGIAEQFQKAFVNLGGRVVSSDGISVGDKDFKALLTRIKDANPSGVYFGGLYTEAGLIVKQMRELGLTALFIGGDGAQTSGFFDVAGSAADGAYLTTIGVPVELLDSAKQFVSDYKKRWNRQGEELKPKDHFSYEAAQVLFDALDKGGAERVKLIEALKQTNHRGVLGVTTFDEKGDTLNQTVTMTRARMHDRSFPAVY